MEYRIPGLQQAELAFTGEIILRTTCMFLLIIILLRLTGRRGVRQLTLFEVAMILALGSAAGDPMFQKEVPVFYAIVVFGIVLAWYKLITFLASRSKLLTRLLEGKEMVVVKNGMFNIEENRRTDFSQNEFFAELRNQSVEHLGQVKIALLEVDGTMSILRYPEQEVRYGLPLFPVDTTGPDNHAPRVCTFCGKVEEPGSRILRCSRCGKNEWTTAINTA